MPDLLEDSYLIAEPKIMPKILNSETRSHDSTTKELVYPSCTYVSTRMPILGI